MSEGEPLSIRPEHPAPRSLASLAEDFGLRSEHELDGVDVIGVAIDGSDVHPGDLFVGLPGARTHGASFAAQAAEAGAVAVLTDDQGAEFAAGAGLPLVIADQPRALLGELSAWIYRTHEDPPLLLGVTGTNGKTSTSYLLDAILTQLGVVTGLSTTAERRIGDTRISSRLTTPEAPDVHALVARMREQEVRAAVLEVSAHALTRHRIDGLVFDVVGFTNLSHDHLDDYADMEEYFQAKLSFFDPDRARRGVVSLDTPWGERVLEGSRIPVSTVSSRPGDEAQWHVDITEESPEGIAFTLTGPEGRRVATRMPVLGRHMAGNAAVAIVMLVEAGYEIEHIGQVLADGIDVYLPGRIERVSGRTGPALFVDFGHSAEAFDSTLAAVRAVTSGRVILVFGASGDRDTTKRPAMARAAVRGADAFVVTDVNPRFEDPAEIRGTLVGAIRDAGAGADLREIADPREAIRAAVAMAEPGDTIVWAGPGHQNYREIRGERIPYSARDEARHALREAGWDPDD